MDRRLFLGILASGLLAAARPADAQPAGKVYRIGAVIGGSRTDSVQPVEAFRQGLRDLGYIEDRNVNFEWRFAEGRLDRVPRIVTELVNLRVDVIFAPGTAAAQAAKKASPTIPIVIATAGNPVGDGLIGSFARPGGNVTGLTMLPGPELGGKYLQLLKEAAPEVSRVAILWNPLTAAEAAILKAAFPGWSPERCRSPPSSGRGRSSGAFAAGSAVGAAIPNEGTYDSRRGGLASRTRSSSRGREPRPVGYRPA
jgi:putative ABC transport system substrate-binding protein